MRTAVLWQVIPGRLSFSAHPDEDFTREAIHTHPELFYFSSDLQERYEPYCLDFGPVNLAVIHRFCTLMDERLHDPRLATRHLVYYCDDEPDLRTNTAFLMAAYLLCRLGWTAEQAVTPFAAIDPTPFRAFRDASFMEPPVCTVTLLDCLSGLGKAVRLGWYAHDSFDVAEYERWDDPRSGDFHEVMPCAPERSKFIAFKGPAASREPIVPGMPAFVPEDYVEVFKDKGVTCVVRLNRSATYSPDAFTAHGIHHADLAFDDCTCPPANVVERFLDLCDAESGGIAVHCRASIGRTGTLIAIWLMKHHGFTAMEAISWLRIVRPGCVIGVQQEYLRAVESGHFEGNRPVLADHLPLNNEVLSAMLAHQLAQAVSQRALAHRG